MKNFCAGIIAIIILAGCATYQPIPEGYVGPTASVLDSGFSESSSKAQIFALTEIEGNRVMNAFLASSNKSQSHGSSLTTAYTHRMVPAKSMKVTIRASHATGAPIHAIASHMAGTFFSVEGTVDFSPEADGRYIVKGELKKDKSSVWIEDSATGKPVTAIVSN